MSASLSIHVASVRQPEKLEVEFFYSQEWTPESESQLIKGIQEILALLRGNAIGIKVSLDISVTDAREAAFVVNKRVRNDIEINHQKLSLRELEVLELIMLGHTNQQIADKLFISFETVRSHRKNILLKTGAKNTAALVHYYHQTFFDKI